MVENNTNNQIEHLKEKLFFLETILKELKSIDLYEIKLEYDLEKPLSNSTLNFITFSELGLLDSIILSVISPVVSSKTGPSYANPKTCGSEPSIE